MWGDKKYGKFGCEESSVPQTTPLKVEWTV
jgi:alpha-tubulin suppressor-like RCC1 family protein